MGKREKQGGRRDKDGNRVSCHLCGEWDHVKEECPRQGEEGFVEQCGDLRAGHCARGYSCKYAHGWSAVTGKPLVPREQLDERRRLAVQTAHAREQAALGYTPYGAPGGHTVPGCRYNCPPGKCGVSCGGIPAQPAQWAQAADDDDIPTAAVIPPAAAGAGAPMAAMVPQQPSLPQMAQAPRSGPQHVYTPTPNNPLAALGLPPQGQPQPLTAGDKRGEQGECVDHRQGKCQRGSVCRYKHAGVILEETEGDLMGQGPCSQYMRGQCVRGSLCKFAHKGLQVNPSAYSWKSDDRTCRHFAAGHCAMGADCRYLHTQDAGTDWDNWGGRGTGAAAAAEKKNVPPLTHDDKQKLCEQVKDLQRCDDAFKAAWSKHNKSQMTQNDPQIHTAEYLHQSLIAVGQIPCVEWEGKFDTKFWQAPGRRSEAWLGCQWGCNPGCQCEASAFTVPVKAGGRQECADYRMGKCLRGERCHRSHGNQPVTGNW